MNLASLGNNLTGLETGPSESSRLDQFRPVVESGEVASSNAEEANVRETFNEVFGEMLYMQMLKGMRKTVGEPAYFHGGRAEEVFTQQLDQVLAQKMASAGGDVLLGSTYDQYAAMSRR